MRRYSFRAAVPFHGIFHADDLLLLVRRRLARTNPKTLPLQLRLDILHRLGRRLPEFAHQLFQVCLVATGESGSIFTQAA
jgi:hypothetical protein